MGLSPIASEK